MRELYYTIVNLLTQLITGISSTDVHAGVFAKWYYNYDLAKTIVNYTIITMIVIILLMVMTVICSKISNLRKKAF